MKSLSLVFFACFSQTDAFAIGPHAGIRFAMASSTQVCAIHFFASDVTRRAHACDGAFLFFSVQPLTFCVL